MFELVFLNIFLIGAGLLILLFIRALPRVDGADLPLRRGMFERWLTSRLPERLDTLFRTVSLRTLRRMKVLTMRLDNSITQRLQRMKLEGGERMNGEKIDFKKMAPGRGASREPESAGRELKS